MEKLKSKLKTIKFKQLQAMIICNFLLFPMRILTSFKVRFTKSFKQYKSNPVSENENQIVVFFIVIWVSYMKSELFYCEKLTSTRVKGFMGSWQKLTMGDGVNLDQKLVDIDFERSFCSKLMSDYAYGSTVWR